MPKPLVTHAELGAAIAATFPEAGEIVAAGGGAPVYLVGGAVRDLLLGRERGDLDLVTEGDPAEIAARLGSETTHHRRFSTAKARLGSHQVDIARARTETYPHPGALPEVSPAEGIAEDLARRDFTINAMAIPLSPADGAELIDPHGGRDDLEAGVLRVLHSGSFADDPTRALRAARYAARFGFELEPGTAELLASADLATVSEDRRRAELGRIAAEATAPRAFELLGEWGLAVLRPGGAELAAVVSDLLASPPWSGFVEPAPAVLAAALGPPGEEADLAAAEPARPSLAVLAAAGRDPVELALARAMGAEWLDDYAGDWRHVRLEIGGDDLIAAGVPSGPAIGRGLGEALRRKLDGEVHGREQELAAALEAAAAD
jgi:tRNA nucleotidyltransferase (CCA-adding enzyme)